MPIMCQSKDRQTKIFSKFHNKVANYDTHASNWFLLCIFKSRFKYISVCTELILEIPQRKKYSTFLSSSKKHFLI